MIPEDSIFLRKEDMDLITRCIRQERPAQNELFHRYSKKMMTLCFRYSRSREDAEDVLTEGFMRVFEKLHTYKGTGPLEGWIRKVILHIAIEKFNRRSKSYPLVHIDAVQLAEHSSYDVYGELNAKELILQIQQLPPVYQMVFNLYVFEGLKHKEIAACLGISEGTSKSNLSDARAWLRKRIEATTLEKKAV